MWPFATSQTLTALANLLNGAPQTVIGADAFFRCLLTYSRSHRKTLGNGRRVPWIEESLDPFTGRWIPNEGDPPRGRDYNHSTFCDLVVTGLVGLRPRADRLLEVSPLLPEGVWDWFRLDRVPYHGLELSIVYDRTGLRYGAGAGLRVLGDGREICGRKGLGRLTGVLP